MCPFALEIRLPYYADKSKLLDVIHGSIQENFGDYGTGLAQNTMNGTFLWNGIVFQMLVRVVAFDLLVLSIARSISFLRHCWFIFVCRTVQGLLTVLVNVHNSRDWDWDSDTLPVMNLRYITFDVEHLWFDTLLWTHIVRNTMQFLIKTFFSLKRPISLIWVFFMCKEADTSFCKSILSFLWSWFKSPHHWHLHCLAHSIFTYLSCCNSSS